MRRLQYALRGGRRRWFERQARLLPESLRRAKPVSFALGRTYLAALDVGLELDPARAWALCQQCSADAAEVCASPRLASECEALLLHAGELGSEAALRVGWKVSAASQRSEPMAAFGRALALRWAEAGDAGALIAHLLQVHALGALQRELMDEVVSRFLERQSLRENPSWRAFFGEIPESLWPPLADIYTLLGKAREAISLARSPTQIREAVDLCVEDGGLELLERAWDASRLASDVELERRVGDRIVAHSQEAAARGDFVESMSTLMRVRAAVASRGEADAVRSGLGARLEAERTELLRVARRARNAQLAAGREREAASSWIDLEESAGEWIEAARLLERTGEREDRLRASQLWERAERYGEAVRTLDVLVDRADARLRIAQLRERAGDTEGAAAAFERLERWSDARRTYQGAQLWEQAARCFRCEHGEARAARSPEYAELVVRAGRDELVALYLDELAAEPESRELAEGLRHVVRDGTVHSPSLRAAAEECLGRAPVCDVRSVVEQAAAAWAAEALRSVEQRYGRTWAMDLGTSKSMVALFDFEQGAPVICPHRGRLHFSSTLAIDRSGLEIVGLDPREQLRPDLRGWSEAAVRDLGALGPRWLGDRQLSAVDIVARFLGHGRALAEAFLCEQAETLVRSRMRAELGVEAAEKQWSSDDWSERLAISLPDAVVTTPASYSFEQRRAFKAAAGIAGIQVSRLLAAPAAACLGVGMARPLLGKMLVVDLGAGTLDISYVDVGSGAGGEGFFEVERTFGDARFGGADLDAVLERELLSQLASTGVTRLDRLERRRLRAAAEQLRIDLSTSARATQELIALAGRPRQTLSLSISDLERLLSAKLDQLDRVCRQAAGLAIDHLVVVGGVTFSPLVRQRIEAAFGRRATPGVDARTAVALGAAWQAAILGSSRRLSSLLLDIAPFALGVLVGEGSRDARVSFHIPRGQRIPHESRKTYALAAEDQTEIGIQVMQGLGESDAPDASRCVSELHLRGIPRVKSKAAQIEIALGIDASGAIEVSVAHPGSGRSCSSRIEEAAWHSEADRDEAIQHFRAGRRHAQLHADVTALAERIDAQLQRIEELEKGGASAETWRREFSAFQRRHGSGSFDHFDAATQARLAEMYGAGQQACDAYTLELAEVRALRARRESLQRAASQLASASGEVAEQRLSELQAGLRPLEARSAEVLDALAQRRSRFESWNAALLHCSTLPSDPRARLAHFHDRGDVAQALRAFDAAFASIRDAQTPLDAVERRLDCLARSRQRDAYRAMLASRHALAGLDGDRLGELASRVWEAVAWIHVGERRSVGGFLVAPDRVAVPRHIAVETEALRSRHLGLEVGGKRCRVARARRPQRPEAELAIVELEAPLEAVPLRVGYTGLVEVGESVFPVGPPASGAPPGERMRIERCVVNRIHRRASGRELELDPAPATEGAPVLNDLGEVVAVMTSASRAIAVEDLHELLQRW